MRCSGSIVSTVAMKLAKGPVKSSTRSPSFNVLEGRILPSVSHRSIRPETSCRGKGLGLLSKLTSRETPMVLLIVRHGARSAFTLTNMYPGKRGLRTFTNREAFLRVISCMGRNVSNPCRCKFRSASRWLLGLNCIKYQWCTGRPRFTICSLLSECSRVAKRGKPVILYGGKPYHTVVNAPRLLPIERFLPAPVRRNRQQIGYRLRYLAQRQGLGACGSD